MHAKVFSIQIFQYFHQIPPRVCTLVLFILIVLLYIVNYIELNDLIIYYIYMYVQSRTHRLMPFSLYLIIITLYIPFHRGVSYDLKRGVEKLLAD